MTAAAPGDESEETRSRAFLRSEPADWIDLLLLLLRLLLRLLLERRSPV